MSESNAPKPTEQRGGAPPGEQEAHEKALLPVEYVA
jgi:hypothetical protein